MLRHNTKVVVQSTKVVTCSTTDAPHNTSILHRNTKVVAHSATNVPCSTTGPKHCSKQAHGKTDTTPQSETEFFRNFKNHKQNRILTMEHRHQVELRGSCGKVAGTRDLATASDGLESRTADFVMASISMEILGALWFPTIFIDF